MAKLNDRPNPSKSPPAREELKPLQFDETIVARRIENSKKSLADILRRRTEAIPLSSLLDLVSGKPIKSFDIGEFERRIQKILGTKNIEVSDRTLNTYLAYLKKNLNFPCHVTGREDFPWEEEYVIGNGNQKRYEQLKKTKPSYTDKFKLLSFIEALMEEDGILVNVQRLTDKKKFVLPLVDLEAVEESSPNYQLLDDYSLWFVNYGD